LIQPQRQISTMPDQRDRLREALADLQPDELTPREALDALYRLKSVAVE